MTLNEYQDAAKTTDTYTDDLVKHNFRFCALAEETGELMGKVKRVGRDHEGTWTEELRDAAAFELGDIMWNVAMCARDLGFTLQQIAEMNITKLASRQARNMIHGSGDHR